MMNEQQTAPRKTILAWLIGFFAAMLALTMFAQSLRTLAIAQVSTEQPRSRTIARQFDGSGTVEGSESHPLLLDVNLKDAELIVDSVSLSPGARVARGDTLLYINKERLDYAVARARAAYDADVSSAEARRDAALLALDEAQNGRSSALVQARRAQEDAAVSFALARIAYAGASAASDAKTEYDAASLALTRANDDLANVQALEEEKVARAAQSLRSAEDALAALTTALPADLAALEALRANGGALACTEAGVLTRIEAKAGAHLADVLGYISPPDAPLVIRCVTDAASVEGFSAGDRVYVALDDAQVELTISAIGDSLDDANEKELQILLSEGEARLGEKIDIRLYRESESYDCVISRSALYGDAEEKYVYVFAPDGNGDHYRAVKTHVTVLAENAQYVAVSGGVSGMDRVITGSNKPIMDGDAVQEVRVQ